MSHFQKLTTDLTGIAMPLNNSGEWEFQGKIISAKEGLGDFDADLAAVSVEHDSLNIDSATVEDGQYNKSANLSARSSFFGHRLSGSTCIASSYVDTEASMIPNYAASSYESMSQYSTAIPTPTTSVDQDGDDKNVSSQNDLVEQQQQTSNSDFSTYTSGPTPLEAFYDSPEQHEQIAYRFSDPRADRMTQKKIKKSTGRKVRNDK